MGTYMCKCLALSRGRYLQIRECDRRGDEHVRISRRLLDEVVAAQTRL
jgi:hypothetical protein